MTWPTIPSLAFRFAAVISGLSIGLIFPETDMRTLLAAVVVAAVGGFILDKGEDK